MRNRTGTERNAAGDRQYHGRYGKRDHNVVDEKQADKVGGAAGRNRNKDHKGERERESEHETGGYHPVYTGSDKEEPETDDT